MLVFASRSSASPVVPFIVVVVVVVGWRRRVWVGARKTGEGAERVGRRLGRCEKVLCRESVVS
jgi:hypothetical protein